MSQLVELETSLGNIRIELDAERAPESTRNFLAYLDGGHYNGTVFHRVIKGFMIQGGGFEPGMKQKPTKEQIKNEANNGVKNDKYTLAMARTSAPHSATAQFFINTTDNAVFAKVVAGNDVVDSIEGTKTARRGGHDDVPVEDVVILSAKRVA
jgi:peptidyl-prolyl cis-trans isomerase B (cyclophilin B)